MKYCTKCGAPLDDSALFCQKCGAPCGIRSDAYAASDDPTGANTPFDSGAPRGYYAPSPAPSGTSKKPSAIKQVAEVFMILGCISSGFALIPLCWTIPMTVNYFRSVKEGRDVSVGFKVCSLLFVNLIAGILMLVDDEFDD